MRATATDVASTSTLTSTRRRLDPDATVASGGGADGVWRDRVAGQRIGPYALVREIGRGGMGVVYLARRVDGQYDRDVALKLLRTAAYDARHRERFLAERQFLAMLSHPHIARMFDGGVTAAGQPFFTMEYVDGVRLDRYCDEQRASIPERIRLFLQVCDAVSAAHRSLVVHRDIKPNNVLVTRDGTTKLLDFGIATVLDADTGEADARGDSARTTADAGGARRRTRRDAEPPAMPRVTAALRLCTPAYASPEQIRGGTVTAASDVYSLGAVLYELLTGLKPPRADEGGVSGATDARAARCAGSMAISTRSCGRRCMRIRCSGMRRSICCARTWSVISRSGRCRRILAACSIARASSSRGIARRWRRAC